jgi:hypothetical protein
MDTVVILAVLAALPIAALTAIVDVMRHPVHLFDRAGTSKPFTVVGVLLSGGVGGIYYWLVVRRRLLVARRLGPPSDEELIRERRRLAEKARRDEDGSW